MNQPKVVFALRLMKILLNNEMLTIDDVAEQLGVVPRTIYRYIDTFKESGFTVINITGNIYCLVEMPQNAPEFDKLVYFSDEVCAALCDYLEERQGITTVAGHEDAVFLSMQNRRITVRAVENLVKKYSKLVTNIKNITPHKLRSTYGTSLYKATGDIYLVADVLGHKDVNTTKKHYAALEDDRRRKAAKYVHLRED